MRAKARLPGGRIIPSFGAFVGPMAKPGPYTVKMIRGKEVVESTVTLVPDPRSSTPMRPAAQREMRADVRAGRADDFTVESIANARDQARDRAAKLETRDPLRKRVDALASALEDQRKALVRRRRARHQRRREAARGDRVLYGMSTATRDGRPSRSAPHGRLARQLDVAHAAFEATMAKEGTAVTSSSRARRSIR